MATPVERLLAKLPDAKQAGKGSSARCPAHEDRRASLSIGEGDEMSELLTAIRTLSLADIERRLADLDAERAALSLLRRSLAARDRAQRRAAAAAEHKGVANG